jgi:hypothetical protein
MPYPDGATVLLEEDAATVTKLLAVLLVPKGLKIVIGWRMHCCAEVTESSTNKQHHLSLPVCWI